MKFQSRMPASTLCASNMNNPKPPLVVALDAAHSRQSNAGVARYGRSLAAALARHDEISVIELGGGDVASRGTIAKRALTLRQDFIWYPWLGRRRARRAGADIYHVPIPRGPMTCGKPSLVLTVHDLVPLLFPGTMTPWSRVHSRLTLRRTLDAADRIITPSRDTADDLESLLGISSSRIRVVHNGVDDLFFGTPDQRVNLAGSESFEGQDPYVLFVGTPEPRKNLDRLRSAMVLLRQRGFRERLVIAGAGGWGTAGVDGHHAALVQRVGRVSDRDLHALYANASCVALPSLHEGFGLTALEAMASGAPVVAANAGALPEITGGAAILVDPLDASDIAEGLARCIGEREVLAAAGRARAGQFTWPRAAEETIAVYRELV